MTARSRVRRQNPSTDIALLDREPARRASTPLRPWIPGSPGGWSHGTFSQPRRSSPVTTCRLSDCIHLTADDKATMQREAEEQRAAIADHVWTAYEIAALLD